MNRPLISLDLETTGLDIQRHEAWEVGLVRLDDDGSIKDQRLYEFSVQDLTASEAGALQVNDYYQRRVLHDGVDLVRREPPDFPRLENEKTLRRHDAAVEIAQYTQDACLLGCAVQFDMRFLEKLLLACNARPCWHHRGLDLGSYAAGLRGARLPLSSGAMAETIENPEAHTALGDAIWNVAVYKMLKHEAHSLQGKQ